jgi:glycosyltransferase involved in cell wall biosynthesis
VIYAAAGSVADGVKLRPIDVDPIATEAAVNAGKQPSAAAKIALDRGFAELFEVAAGDRPDAVSQHAFDAPAVRLAEHLPVIHTLHLPPVIEDVVEAAKQSSRPIATVSEAARRDWETAGLRQVHVLRNGVPSIDIDGVGPAGDVAVVAGRISPEKGTHTAIAVARRAGLQPRVVGDVYDRAYYEEQVRPLLGTSEFMGPLPRAELMNLMSQSAVLLMPVEWEEPFGLVAAEAQMCGCPVVGYRRGALPEIVKDGVGGWLVDPGDEAALLAAVRRGETLDRARIRLWARANLGVERMVHDYELALERIANGSPRL